MGKNSYKKTFIAFRYSLTDNTSDEIESGFEEVLAIGYIDKVSNRVEMLICGTSSPNKSIDSTVLEQFLSTKIGRDFLRRKEKVIHIITDDTTLANLIEGSLSGKIKYTDVNMDYRYDPIDKTNSVRKGYDALVKLFTSKEITVVDNFPNCIPQDLVKYSSSRPSNP